MRYKDTKKPPLPRRLFLFSCFHPQFRRTRTPLARRVPAKAGNELSGFDTSSRRESPDTIRGNTPKSLLEVNLGATRPKPPKTPAYAGTLERTLYRPTSTLLEFRIKRGKVSTMNTLPLVTFRQSLPQLLLLIPHISSPGFPAHL
jgi:hypothetical protein